MTPQIKTNSFPQCSVSPLFSFLYSSAVASLPAQTKRSRPQPAWWHTSSIPALQGRGRLISENWEAEVSTSFICIFSPWPLCVFEPRTSSMLRQALYGWATPPVSLAVHIPSSLTFPFQLIISQTSLPMTLFLPTLP